MSQRVLMIAYHFPPLAGSSGVLRTLKFAKYLPENGWEPIVLTANPRAYAQADASQLGEIAPSTVVKRAFALDAARHLSLHGRYPAWFALPDRWGSWWFGAMASGLKLIARHRPQVLWSTYPIATAHLIGLALARMSGIPWIADFRDSMTEENYPRDPRTRSWYCWIERHTVARARHSVFTTPGAQRMYASRYSELPASRWKVIANGYDEENFTDLEQQPHTPRPEKAPLTLVHSGILYPKERDPRHFFAALNELRNAGAVGPETLKVILRATAHDDYYRALIQQSRIEDMVVLAPALSYRDALSEMLGADGLLVFQAASCNHQIPAKLYEYLRARRPIFALTDDAGDTAKELRQAGIGTIVPLDSQRRIRDGLSDFLERVRAGCAPIAADREIIRRSRRAQTAELAAILENTASSGKSRSAGPGA